MEKDLNLRDPFVQYNKFIQLPFNTQTDLRYRSHFLYLLRVLEYASYIFCVGKYFATFIHFCFVVFFYIVFLCDRLNEKHFLKVISWYLVHCPC
jgi:hypothetical protein